MTRALRAWAINRGGKNSVRNLRYGPRTRLVRGMHRLCKLYHMYLHQHSVAGHAGLATFAMDKC